MKFRRIFQTFYIKLEVLIKLARTIPDIPLYLQKDDLLSLVGFRHSIMWFRLNNKQRELFG